jgi:hypothetical protein
MAKREQVINKLKERGYKFKTESERVLVFKKGTHRLEIPRRDLLDEKWIRSAFRQAGMTNEEITEFLRQCTN